MGEYSYTSSDFKTKLDYEMEYKTKYNIKMIQICVQGGFDTLLVIQESLKAQVPILILAVCFNFISCLFSKEILFKFFLGKQRNIRFDCKSSQFKKA